MAAVYPLGRPPNQSSNESRSPDWVPPRVKRPVAWLSANSISSPSSVRTVIARPPSRTSSTTPRTRRARSATVTAAPSVGCRRRAHMRQGLAQRACGGP